MGGQLGAVRAPTGSSSSGSKQPWDTRVTERPNISRISAMAALLQACFKSCKTATAGCRDAVATQSCLM